MEALEPLECVDLISEQENPPSERPTSDIGEEIGDIALFETIGSLDHCGGAKARSGVDDAVCKDGGGRSKSSLHSNF